MYLITMREPKNSYSLTVLLPPIHIRSRLTHALRFSAHVKTFKNGCFTINPNKTPTTAFADTQKMCTIQSPRQSPYFLSTYLTFSIVFVTLQIEKSGTPPTREATFRLSACFQTNRILDGRGGARRLTWCLSLGSSFTSSAPRVPPNPNFQLHSHQSL